MAEADRKRVRCTWCGSARVLPYGRRFYCTDCGWTWHRTARTVDEERDRRRKAAGGK